MSSQVNNVVKSANYHLRNIGRIRKYLTDSAAKLLIQSLEISRMDYCNSLFAGITENLLHKLQLTQNRAARIISRTRRDQHITPVLKRLHWLPMRQRVDFKTLLLVYKCRNGLAPSYLSELLTLYEPSRSLRSQNLGLLHVPRYRLGSYGGRSFAVYATKLWNGLNIGVRTARTIGAFKKGLKTELFMW